MPTGVYERKLRTPEEAFWPRVDCSGDCWFWLGSTNSKGYGQLSFRGKYTTAHKLAYELLVGPIPEGHQLDHRHTCPKNCVNPTHLRPVTCKQNIENRAGPSMNTTSGVLGVYWESARQRWRVRVKHHGKAYYNGTYRRKELAEAEAAVIELRNRLFTHNDRDREGS